MNVRWWKTGRSSAGTPAGEQTGLLPSIWQVSAWIVGFAPAGLFLLAPPCVTVLQAGRFERPLWLNPTLCYVQQMNCLNLQSRLVG